MSTTISDPKEQSRCGSALMALPHKIGFVGSGQMAIALGKGFMAAGLVSPPQVLASAPSDTNLALWRQLGAETTHKNSDIVQNCDVIFLAVKPQILPVVMEEWQDEVRKGSDVTNDPGDVPSKFLCTESKLFVSVLAGVKTGSLYSHLSSVVPNPRVIRANPNTPCMVGCGASGFSLGKRCNSGRLRCCQATFKQCRAVRNDSGIPTGCIHGPGHFRASLHLHSSRGACGRGS